MITRNGFILAAVILTTLFSCKNEKIETEKSLTTETKNLIKSLGLRYEVPITYAPYMTIIKKDSSTFRVYVEGSKKEIESFFTEAIQTWKKNKD